MKLWVSMVVFIAAVILVGCDKAKDDYAKCIQAETTGDLQGLMKACNDAIGADPNSISGKAAAAKLMEVKPKYDKWKSDQDAKEAAAAEAKKAADAAQAQVQAAAQAETIAALKRRVRGRFAYNSDPDDRCLAESKPPFAKDYGGGTYEENEYVALADGCVHLFGKHTLRSPNDNSFCCPK